MLSVSFYLSFYLLLWTTMYFLPSPTLYIYGILVLIRLLILRILIFMRIHQRAINFIGLCA